MALNTPCIHRVSNTMLTTINNKLLSLVLFLSKFSFFNSFQMPKNLPEQIKLLQIQYICNQILFFPHKHFFPDLTVDIKSTIILKFM